MSIKMWGWFRWLVTLAAVLAFAQAALAGAFLSGHYGALNLHSVNANIAATAALGATVVGFLIRRPGGGPWWPALASGGILLAEVAQTAFGYARSLSLHVPLGVGVIAGLIVLLIRVWRPDAATPPPDRPAPAAPAPVMTATSTATETL